MAIYTFNIENVELKQENKLQFKSFNSLENTYRDKEIQRVIDHGSSEQLWIATEKVHGANFSFWKTKDEMKVAKRSGFIELGEKFFNYAAVVDKYKGNLYELHKIYGFKDIVVYGELFGGNIQKGMSYQDEQDFIAFDLVVDGKVIDKLTALYNMNYVGFKTVPVIGTFENLSVALSQSEEFNSLLTPLDKDAAPSEGIVIEPVEPSYFANGSRIYFKKKSKYFNEKVHSNTHKGDKKSTELFISEEGNDLLGEMEQYITKARFESVVSKIGEVTIKDIAKITGLMAQDLIEDWQKDNELVFKDSASTQDASIITKQLNRKTMEFIRPILLNN